MKLVDFLAVSLAVGVLFLTGNVAQAQQHRATRLGNPATRFAPPLKTPVDLRLLFRNEKLRPDIASILEQWGWTGRLEDLHSAAHNAEISEWPIPVGSRMPFMSSREGGKPVTLRDVLWAGDEPAPAYAFTFSSNGRRYRCITPKACSNFFLVDLGPDVAELRLLATAPAEVDTCAPFEMRVSVQNTSTVPATGVRLVQTLGPGLHAADDQTSLDVEVGTLVPGEVRELRFDVRATATGSHVGQSRVTGNGVTAEAASRVVARAPVLTLECAAPEEMLVGIPVEVCLTARNTGNAPEPRATLMLSVPAGATVVKMSEGGVTVGGQIVWQYLDVAPDAVAKACASLALPMPAEVKFDAAAMGECAPAVQAACATRMQGIPAILLDAVDLEDPVQVGREVTYVIYVTNQGSAPGTNVRLVCTVPDSQEFVSGSGPTAVHHSGSTVTTDPLPNLAPKAVATWRVVTRALRPDDARFRLHLSSDEFERPILEEESTKLY